ncbi:SDR family oxidoreductase [Nioella aestuarii]|uniref:SDR family oxidoreductase n=1 Tax=Nioella aestuarii TaxID=1662864 RepID=UPI003D7F777D
MHAVVTGASRGIGLELVRQLCARGDAVLGTCRDGETRDVGAWQALDVTDPASVAALSAAHSGPVDLLVCNAGVYLDKLHQIDDGFPPEMWAHTFAVNVTGVFLTVQALLPQLRAAGGAKIAIIGSQMGSDTKAPGGSFIYRASKAAALNLGRNLAAELLPEGIAVGVYHPGWVQTDMGGTAADITVRDSAEGLLARFDALSLASTGCFLTWDGREHPY